jgi:hypothetical protein
MQGLELSLAAATVRLGLHESVCGGLQQGILIHVRVEAVGQTVLHSICSSDDPKLQQQLYPGSGCLRVLKACTSALRLAAAAAAAAAFPVCSERQDDCV